MRECDKLLTTSKRHTHKDTTKNRAAYTKSLQNEQPTQALKYTERKGERMTEVKIKSI